MLEKEMGGEGDVDAISVLYMAAIRRLFFSKHRERR